MFSIFIRLRRTNLISTLEFETKNAIHWLYVNNMIPNPDKFQALITSMFKKEA